MLSILKLVKTLNAAELAVASHFLILPVDQASIMMKDTNGS
jgi:hypothetical protein